MAEVLKYLLWSCQAYMQLRLHVEASCGGRNFGRLDDCSWQKVRFSSMLQHDLNLEIFNSSQTSLRLTSSKTGLIIHCGSAFGVLMLAILSASWINSMVYLKHVLLAVKEYLIIWEYVFTSLVFTTANSRLQEILDVLIQQEIWPLEKL